MSPTASTSLALAASSAEASGGLSSFGRMASSIATAPRTTSEQEAIAHLWKRVEEFAQGKYVGAHAERVTVADLLKLVTADYATAGNRSGRTLEYRVAALVFELGHLRATNVSPSVVEAYKTKRLSVGKAK